MYAIEKMGKKKAASVDEVLDLIFQKQAWRRLYGRLKFHNQLRHNWAEIQCQEEEINKELIGKDEHSNSLLENKSWISHVRYILAKNLG